MGNLHTLKAGDLAYLDSFSGLVPCKVLTVDSDTEATVRVTAARPGYTVGEIITQHKRHLLKRTQVHVRDGQYRVTGSVLLVPDKKTRGKK